MTWITDFILGLLVVFCFYLSPLRILQYFIIFASTADEYFSALILCFILPVLFYKTYQTQGRFKLSKITLLLIFWLCYGALTGIWAYDKFRYFTEIVQLAISLALMYLIYVNVRNQDDLIKILNAATWAGIMVATLTIVYYKQFEADAVNYYAIIALFTLIAYPLARFKKLASSSSLWIFPCIAIGIVVIMIHDSRAALGLSGIIIMWRFFWLNKMNKKLKYLLVFVGVLIIGLYMGRYLLNTDYFLDVTDTQQNFSNLERLSLLQQSWDLFRTHPFGMGQGACNNIFMNSTYTIQNYPHPHNTFAHLMVELGVVGLIIYIILLIYILRSWFKSNKYKKLSDGNFLIFIGLGLSFAILFAYSFFEDFLFNGVFNLYMFTFIGICLAMKKLNCHK